MKRFLLLVITLNIVFGLTTSKAQNCINYELAQQGIGTLGETFGVSLADFNGDGWTDVVTIDAYDDIEIYFGNGAGLMDTNAYTLGANRWRFGVQVIDIENDGDWDFVCAPMSSQSYGIEVWQNNGSGVFTLKSDNTANYSGGHELAVGDLNGDGYDDIFFPNNDKVGIYLNDGSGTFIDNGQEDLYASSPEGAVLFDADNDGDLDAAVSTGFTGKFFTNDGTGHFTEAQNNMSDNTEGVGAGDINGDGYNDLVFAAWYGYLEIWYNDGLGTFLPGDTLFQAGQHFYIDVELRDLNYDNLPDIITNFFVMLNNPDDPGAFLNTSYIPSCSTHDFETGDINNDGFLDIYMGCFSSNNGDRVILNVPGTMLYVDTTLCFGDSLLVGGIWETESGEYMGSVGCDSIMNVTLSFYDEISTNVILNGITLTALANGVSYQWINCADSSIIEGATEQSFTPEETGEYAVILTNGPCSEISDCYTVITTNVNHGIMNDITFYPNPNNGIFYVKCYGNSSQMTMSISDVIGNIVYQSNITGETNKVDISAFKPGIYILTLNTGASIIIKRILTQ